MAGSLAALFDDHARTFRRGLHCPQCGADFRDPTPALFAFNSPLGACTTCQGFGRVIGVDLEKVIPDPTRDSRGPAGGSLEHARLRIGVPRSLSRLPTLLRPHRHSRRAALASRESGLARRPRRVLWDPRLLRLARDEAVQDPRAGDARAIPGLHAVSLVPGGAAVAGRSIGSLSRRRRSHRLVRDAALRSSNAGSTTSALSHRGGGAPLLGRRRDALPRSLHERRRARLSDSVPGGPNPLGRRGPADRARVGAGRLPDGDALRSRRTHDRSPCRGYAAICSRSCGGWPTGETRSSSSSMTPRRSRRPIT